VPFAPGDAKDYQWSWQDDTGLFAAFYDEDNEFLEKAYQKDPVFLLWVTWSPPIEFLPPGEIAERDVFQTRLLVD